MRRVVLLILLGLGTGCASGPSSPGDAREPHFAAHEGRPEPSHHSSGGGASRSTNDDGDGILGTILGVLFGGDDD